MQYFYGKDSFGGREEIEVIAEKLTAKIRWLDKEELDRKSISDWLDGAGGLFGNDLIVVRDASTMPKAVQEQIVDEAKRGRELEWIVWDRENPDKRSALFKTLKKYGREFSEPSRQQLIAWLQSVGNIETAAAGELVTRRGADRWQLYNELQRLLLISDPVTQDTVREQVAAGDIQEEIFAALDAISSGNSGRAIRQFERMLAAGEKEIYILAMLAYQYKTLLAVRQGNVKSLHPFVVQKSQTTAQRYSENALQNTLTRIMATDFAIKQGKVDARTGLMMLLVGLAQNKTPA